LRQARKALGHPKDSEKEIQRRRLNSHRRSKVRYKENRALIDGIKLSSGCIDCGYRSHPAALEFDHLPGCEKKDTLARLAGVKSRQRILDEIAKCEVVCANCHAIRTAIRRVTRAHI
jgi:hypothetical protein